MAGDLVLQDGADFEFLLVGLLVGRGRAVGDVGAVFGWEEPFHCWAGGGEADEGDLLGEGVAAQRGDDGCYAWGEVSLQFLFCGKVESRVEWTGDRQLMYYDDVCIMYTYPRRRP